MRTAGILLHPTSLPGAGPCGDLGDGALAFLDWLAAAGVRKWQILPLNPPGAGFSPYDSPSAFAGATHLLSLARLAADGLLDGVDLRPPPGDGARVNRAVLDGWHAPRVRIAAARLADGDPAALAAFEAANPWVADWALYKALVEAQGRPGWTGFDPAVQKRTPSALAAAREKLMPAVQQEVAAQLLFARQWAALRAAARERGVQIVGDVPIFVSSGSCDVWAHRRLFRGHAGADGWRAEPITGVPPDYFSPTGQRWGNPHYAWAEHKRTKFAWWVARFRQVFSLVDVARVDHFRGFAAAWEIAADAPDATGGRWAEGPGRALFDAVRAELGALPLIAEDLGLIDDAVHALRDGLGLPGMKILQFAFGGTNAHAFLPHTWAHPRWVAYTGTHDNDTALGWYRSAGARGQHRYRVYVGRDGAEPGWDLIRLAWSSVADTAVAPMQDVLGLGAEARLNTPGTATGNWEWRCTDLPGWAARRLRDLAEAYGRVEDPEAPAR